jgi:hypothetical protein
MKKPLLLLTLAPADLFCRPMKGWKQIKGDYFLPPFLQGTQGYIHRENRLFQTVEAEGGGS